MGSPSGPGELADRRGGLTTGVAAPRRRPIGRALLLMLGLAACSRSPSLPPGWTEVEARAFQQQAGQALLEPVSPLSAVASHYVGPGESLALGLVDGELAAGPRPGTGPRVVVEVGEGQARCSEGCGPEPVPLSGHRVASLGRYRLALSPQSGAARIVVHDPRVLDGAALPSWYPVDAGFIVPARFVPDTQRPTVELSTSRGLTKSFVQVGTFELVVKGEAVTLTGYGAGQDKALLIPMTDRTTGDGSYPVGRYLNVEVPATGTPVVDFNRATNPWCAYSEHYNCPIPPPRNELPVAIMAGERRYADH